MLKRIPSIVLPVLVSLILLEAVFRLLGVPRGGSKFVETIVWRNQLAARPAAGEFRIFTYGESTFVGAHHAPVSSPVRWLAAYLKDYLPSKNTRVVNFARMGRGSAFTLQTFRETLDYQPRVAIFYLGHNDFLPGERVDENDITRQPQKAFWLEILYGSRFIAFFYRAVSRVQIARREARDRDRMGAEEIEAPPHELNMGAAVARNTPLYRQNMEFVRKNLNEIMQLAAQHHVKVLFLRPVSNLKDFQPLTSGHLTDLTPEALQAWGDHFNRGETLFKQNDFLAARQAYLEAYRLDPTYALLAYRLGRIAFYQGELDLARRYFIEARDLDWMPCRANQDILDLLDQVSRRYGVPLMETEKVIVPEVPGGIPGEPVIEDNVHFSIPGQSRVGRAVAGMLADLGWIEPRSAWKFGDVRSYDQMAQDLGITPELEAQALLRVCSYLGNRFEDRIRTAERAFQMAPDNLPVLRNLAWTYWISDQRSKASAIYQKIRIKDPDLMKDLLKKHPELKAL